MKTVKYLPKEILNKRLINNYDLIVIPIFISMKYINKEHLFINDYFKIPNKKMRIGDIKIITNNNKDIMFIRYPFNSIKKSINIFNNMLEIIKLNEYKNILLFDFNYKRMNGEILQLLNNYIKDNNSDIDLYF